MSSRGTESWAYAHIEGDVLGQPRVREGWFGKVQYFWYDGGESGFDVSTY